MWGRKISASEEADIFIKYEQARKIERRHLRGIDNKRNYFRTLDSTFRSIHRNDTDKIIRSQTSVIVVVINYLMNMK